MNKDQIKGAAKIVAGKVQEKAGSMTYRKEHPEEGRKP